MNLTQKYSAILNTMSLREKIGQTVVALANMTEIKNKYSSIEEYFEKFPVAGLYIGAQAWLNPEESYEKEWFIEANAKYQKATKHPLLIVEDMENGPGFLMDNMPMLPHLMALGASQSEELAYEYGKAIAFGSHSLGVNWLLNPVADISFNPFSPSVNVRAISDKPELVAKLIKQIVKGIEDNGVASCVKHFPGDGIDFREQHAVKSYNWLSEKDWMRSFGKVYKEAFAAGASTVMTGHIALPSFQTEKIDGSYPPATLSKELSIDLLRNELGFEGVLVSDAVVMGGFKKTYDNQAKAELECFKAGHDIVLWPTDDYFTEMEKAIEKGDISMSQLDASVSRVLELKSKTGVLKQEALYTPYTEEKNSYIENISTKLADKSITLIRDEDNFLPIHTDRVKTALIVGVANNNVHYKNMEVIKQEMETRGVKTTIQRNIDYEQQGWKDIYSQGHDIIIIALARFPQRPFGAMNFASPEFFSLWGALCHGNEKTIVVSFGNPYHFKEHFEASKIYINAYSFVTQSMRAFVKSIFGEIPFNDTPPVNLELDNVHDLKHRFE